MSSTRSAFAGTPSSIAGGATRCSSRQRQCLNAHSGGTKGRPVIAARPADAQIAEALVSGWQVELIPKHLGLGLRQVVNAFGGTFDKDAIAARGLEERRIERNGRHDGQRDLRAAPVQRSHFLWN